MKLDFFFVARDIKVDLCNHLNDLLEIPKVKVIYWPMFWMPQIQYFNFISSKPAGLIETYLHMEPLLNEGLAFCAWDLGHMTKMAIMPIYDRPFENLLRADFLETFYAARRTQALPRVSKKWPLVDLVLFRAKVELGHLGICMGKGKPVDFFLKLF